MKNLKGIAKRFAEWILVAVLFAGVLYAASTSWQNDKALQTVAKDVKDIKRSMVSMLLEEKPDKKVILKDLVSDAAFSQGVKEFKAGNYTGAYKAWGQAALRGNRDSIYAMAISKEVLESKAKSTALAEDDKLKVLKALEYYAENIEIKERKGIYYWTPLVIGGLNEPE